MVSGCRPCGLRPFWLLALLLLGQVGGHLPSSRRASSQNDSQFSFPSFFNRLLGDFSRLPRRKGANFRGAARRAPVEESHASPPRPAFVEEAWGRGMGMLPVPPAEGTREPEATPSADRGRTGASRESGRTVQGLRRPIPMHGQDAHATWRRPPASGKISEIGIPDAGNPTFADRPGGSPPRAAPGTASTRRAGRASFLRRRGLR